MQDLHVNGLIRSNPLKTSLIKCKYYIPQAKIKHFKHIFKDTHLNKHLDINQINKTIAIMHIVVMNNDILVATHLKIVSRTVH